MFVKTQLILITFLFVLTSCQDLHEFLGLNVPFFNRTADLLFSGQVGGTAFLQCEVHNLNNKSVSWLRERDRHILTVDRETFISDPRFSSLHTKTPISDLVTLSIQKVKVSDGGRYQCQVSAEDKISVVVELVVVSPMVRLYSAGGGDQEIHVKEGSSVKLKCVVTNILEPPQYVTWYLNDKVNSFSNISHIFSSRGWLDWLMAVGLPNLALYYITRYQSEDKFTYLAYCSTANYTQQAGNFGDKL